jgi:hypothetical protein
MTVILYNLFDGDFTTVDHAANVFTNFTRRTCPDAILLFVHQRMGDAFPKYWTDFTKLGRSPHH